jgi:hypothetical protein
MKKKELLKRIEALENKVNSMRGKEIARGIEKKNTDENTCDTVSVDCTISLPTLSNWNAEKVEKFNKFKPQDEIIYVPKGILRYNYNEIINGKQVLGHDKYGWNVTAYYIVPNSTEKQYKLVPCERKDLKVGNVAFCYLPEGQTDIDYVKEDLSCYCIVTESGIVHWDYMGVTIHEKLNSDYIWYKVVKA